MLPKVSEAVHSTFAESSSLEYETDKDFMEKNLALVIEENPEIYYFMKNWCSTLHGQQFAKTLIGMLGVYRLLYNQDEVNGLESDRGTSYNVGKEDS
jgi:hypothetical protein